MQVPTGTLLGQQADSTQPHSEVIPSGRLRLVALVQCQESIQADERTTSGSPTTVPGLRIPAGKVHRWLVFTVWHLLLFYSYITFLSFYSAIINIFSYFNGHQSINYSQLPFISETNYLEVSPFEMHFTGLTAVSVMAAVALAALCYTYFSTSTSTYTAPSSSTYYTYYSTSSTYTTPPTSSYYTASSTYSSISTSPPSTTIILIELFESW